MMIVFREESNQERTAAYKIEGAGEAGDRSQKGDYWMNLNGWMRLGIALSVAWFVVIGYLAYEDLSELSRIKKFEVSKEGVGEATFVFSASQTDSEIELDIRENLVPQLEKNPQLYIRETITTPLMIIFGFI